MQENLERLGKNNHKISVAVQGTYPSLEQNLVKKKYFVSGTWRMPSQTSIFPENDKLGVKRRNTNVETKYFPASRVFSTVFVKKVD